MPEPTYQQRPRRRASPLRGLVSVVVALLLLPYLIAPFYNFIRPVSTPMLWRYLTLQRVERIYTPIERLGRSVPLAVIIAEDGRFCSHAGVDFQEIQNAIADAEDMDDVRGGSTITQQVAKNLFLWGGRSFVRKALEFPLALWIDLVMSKRRVLEIYLNIAEWGPDGEFGAEAGSRRAFGRSASALGLQEAAALAAMLPNPVVRDARRPGPAMRRLAGVYVSRASSASWADQCVRRTP
ncbi:MAG: monofunctional biosynthetic peptidoglycan transglycosylase [Pseudolabrys sp.]|nr:monofunctional biosynthetic peptidoglycan transglycosylase [Pseudolabrys sp.]